MQQNIDSSDISFWRNLALVALFFALTPIAIGVTFYTIFTTSKPDQEIATSVVAMEPQVRGVQVFASLPDVSPEISGVVGVQNARVEIIRQYLTGYESPMKDHAELLVRTAEKYGLDFRLLTAIAQQESNLCKRIPENTYNCWGWGIHSRGTLGFQSFEEGIEVVSKGLKEKYIDKGYTNAEEIMSKYTPHSPEGAWAKGVNQFLEEMR